MAITVLLFSSCSPVTHENIEKEDVEITEDSSKLDSASNDGKTIAISFSPVYGARSYAVTITNQIDEPMLIEPVLANGIYTATIDLSTSRTRAASNTISGTLYASTEQSSVTTWNKVTDFEAEYTRASIDSYAPAARVEERTRTGAIIEITDAPESDMQYKATFEDGTEKTYSSTPIELTGLSETDTCQITIAHRFKDTEEWGAKTTTLTVGAFEGEQVLKITYAADSKDITVTDIPTGSTSIELVKESTGRVVASASLDGNASSYTFKADEAFTVFDAGVFKAKAMSADTTVISKTIDYASPITDYTETKGRQHYKITFPTAEDLSLNSDPTISIDGAAAAITQQGNTATISINGLESLTSYNATLSNIVDSSNSISIPLSFTTESFAGYYEFNDPGASSSDKCMDKFYVVVEENTSSSSGTIKYYVYSNEGDGMHRIMPLIDGEVKTGESIKYEGDTAYQKAYQWNNTKWNTMSSTPLFCPTEWSIKSFNVDSESYNSIVNSVALGIPTETLTTFTFVEDDSFKQSIVFFNKITTEGGFLDYNSFLNKNRIATSEDQGFADKGDDAPYYFRLEFKGELSK